jgi:hypothetical protein
MLKPLAAVVMACALCMPFALCAHGDADQDHDTDSLPAPVAPVGTDGQLRLSADLGRALGIRTAVVAADHPAEPRMAQIIGDPTKTRRVPAPYAGRLVAPRTASLAPVRM